MLHLRCEWPQRRRPAMFLLDDPTPGLNLMHWHEPGRGHVRTIPNDFAARFAEVAEEHGLRGKFSLVPYPAGLGRVDRAVEGLNTRELGEFLDIVRERIAPQFDVTPEMVTHHTALDLGTGRLLDLREDEWASRQRAERLAEYIHFGATILHNAGLEVRGVTSPWSFGIEVEAEYCRAIADAIAGRPAGGTGHQDQVSFYFLHTRCESSTVVPQLMYLNRPGAEAVVSIPSGAGGHCCSLPSSDFAWHTQYGSGPCVDGLISADGTVGRLVRLFEEGGCLSFHSHWQALYSNGSRAGLMGLAEVVRRVNARFGEHVRWICCSDLARHIAAAEVVTLTARPSESGDLVIDLESLFDCPDFTLSVSLPQSGDVQGVDVDGVQLRHLSDRAPVLTSHSWTRDGECVRVCFDLHARTILTLTDSLWRPGCVVFDRRLGAGQVSAHEDGGGKDARRSA